MLFNKKTSYLLTCLLTYLLTYFTAETVHLSDLTLLTRLAECKAEQPSCKQTCVNYPKRFYYKTDGGVRSRGNLQNSHSMKMVCVCVCMYG